MDTLTALKAGFATLYKSKAFTDCTVTCGPKTFSVHKAILSGQSEYFMKALQSGKFKEGNTGVIKLKAASDDAEDADNSCDAPEIVELMIEYFYQFDYLRTAAADGRPSLIKHAKVFSMAIKYQVDGLRALAVQKFKQAASTDWSSEDFAHVVHVVHTSTPDDAQELREIVTDTIYDHFADLKDKEELEVVISGLGDLSYSLLRRTSSAFRCTKEHTKNATRLSCKCDHGTCGYNFDICQQCHASRGRETEPQINDAEAQALIIGLGIGTAPKAFIGHGINTTIVELDPVVHSMRIRRKEKGFRREAVSMSL